MLASQRKQQILQILAVDDDPLIGPLLRWLQLNHAQAIDLTRLAERAHCSTRTLLRRFKAATGLTPNDYIKLIRLNKAAELLSSGSYKVNEVCYLVGFNTPSYFAKCFYKQFNKLPSSQLD